MRALTYDGKRDRVQAVPAWVVFSLGVTTVAADCERCGRSEAIDLKVKKDAERSLGRFALFHAGCRDPAEIRRAVEEAKRQRRERQAREAGLPSVIYVRKPGGG